MELEGAKFKEIPNQEYTAEFRGKRRHATLGYATR
jgi:hypothetical protein